MAGLGEHLVLEPLLPPAWAVVIAVSLVVVTLGSARAWSGGLQSGRRRILVSARVLLMAGMAMLMLGPQVRWQGRRDVPAEVAVLVDASRSMGIRDAGTAETMTRAEAVRAAVGASGDAFGDLARRARVRPFAFGSRVRPSEGFAVEPVDPRTDLAEALRVVSTRTGRTGGLAVAAPAAVVLLSDGCANRSVGEAVAAARRLAGQGVTVHTVCAGSTEPTGRVCDAAVRGLQAPRRVFLGNKAEVRATVSMLGLKGKRVEVVLTVDGKEAERRDLMPDRQRAVAEVIFTPLLTDPGPARLALAVEPVEGELVTTNDRVETIVRVEEGGIRVLYVEGRLRPEGKYLARVLADAREIELERRLLVGTGADEAAPGPEDLDDVDVVILGDLPASALPAGAIERLAGGVRAGEMSVLTLGGLHAYGRGGWAETSLADLLPVAPDPSVGAVDGPIQFRLTAEGTTHFVFRGDGRRVAGTEGLPPLSGASGVGRVRSGARLLAETAEGAPLLVARAFGRGRVASAMADTTWRWALAPAETGGPEMHRRLWRRLVLWLAGRDGPPRDDLWVMADRTRYVIVDRDRPPVAEVTVGVTGDARPHVRLSGPVSVEVPVEPVGPTDRSRRRWRGTARLTKPGEYRLLAEGLVGGQTKRAETRLTVTEQDFEFAALLADGGRLEAIARAGGGTAGTLKELPGVLRSVAGAVEPRQVPARRRLPLARGRLFLAALVGLMAAEWVLRRRWGLV